MIGHIMRRHGFKYDALPQDGAVQYLLYRTPLYIFHNGALSVKLFFIVSGFSLTYYFFLQHDYYKLAEMAILRMFRLGVPMIASALIVYWLLYNNLYHSAIAEPFLWDATVGTIIQHLLGFDFAYASYNAAFWTMSYEYHASMIIFLLLMIMGRRSVWVRLSIYLVLTVLLRETLYLGFVLGVLLCDLIVYYDLHKLSQHYFFVNIKKIEIFSVVLFLLCVWALRSIRSLESIINFYIIDINFIEFLLVLFVVIIAALGHHTQQFFSNRLSVHLGKLSFSLYLTHLPVIYTVSFWFDSMLAPLINNETITSICVIVSTSVVAIVFSYLFMVLVEHLLLKHLMNHLRLMIGKCASRIPVLIQSRPEHSG